MDFGAIRRCPDRGPKDLFHGALLEYNAAVGEVYPPVWESATSPPEPSSLPWIR
jgi:hypothetical protein